NSWPKPPGLNSTDCHQRASIKLRIVRSKCDAAKAPATKELSTISSRSPNCSTLSGEMLREASAKAVASSSCTSGTRTGSKKLTTTASATPPNSVFTQETVERSTAAIDQAMTSTIMICGSCRTIHHPRAGKAAQSSSPAPVCAPLRSVIRATVAALNQASSGLAAASTATIVACVRPRKINSANVRMKLRQLDLVAIRIGQQRNVARALDCGRHLTLITRLRPCDTAGNDFTGFGNVAFQRLIFFVIVLFYTSCS